MVPARGSAMRDTALEGSTSVSIVIPTLNRPASLRRALESALAQRELDANTVEIIIVDNSPTGGAAEVIADLSSQEKWPIRLVNLPKPGISDARNAGVAAARAEWIAFLDDDQEASPFWIRALLDTAVSTGADAVFGPIEARADGPGIVGPLAPYFSRTVEADQGADITSRAAYLGTNNSMFHRLRCLNAEKPFDPTLNAIGGEDSLLLKQLALSGRHFAWAINAFVIEWVPPRRLNWSYVLRRKFLSGQIRTLVLHRLGRGQWPEILFWMTIGAVQATFGAFASLLIRPFDTARAYRLLAIAYGGLGKLFWAERFRLKLYGAGHVT